MFVCKNVLDEHEIKYILERLKKADWQDGQTNASKKHKNNLEFSCEKLSNSVAQKILQHPTIQQYALIKNIMLPRFNKYKGNGTYNKHVDFFKQNGLRTDWSMTLFLTDPKTYKGGELIIEDATGTPHEFKLDAGDMILYESGLVHHVTPVTKGERIAVISWAESEVEDYRERMILGKLTDLMLEFEGDYEANHDKVLKLQFVHTNLLKKWGK